MTRRRVVRVLQALGLAAGMLLIAGFVNLLFLQTPKVDDSDGTSAAAASPKWKPPRPPAAPLSSSPATTEKEPTDPATKAGSASSTASPRPSRHPGTQPSHINDKPTATDVRDQAALRFVRAYTDTDRPRKKWLADIRKLSTQHLSRGLSHTDLAVVPDSPPTGQVETQTRAEVAITKQLPLKSGPALVVTLTPSGSCPHGWCVDRVLPAGGARR